MYCRKCGKAIPDDSRFCQYCGVAVQTADEAAVERTIVITPQEAETGVLKTIIINGMDEPLRLMIPAKIRSGQLLRLHKVKVKDSNGKQVKKDLLLKIEIADESI